MSDVRICAVTVASDRNHPGLKRLQRTLDYHGWELRFAGDPSSYRGFTSKLTGVQSVLPSLREENWTHILFTDAYDTKVLGSPSEVSYNLRKFWRSDCAVFSAEQACWPDSAREKDYPKVAKNLLWRYLNSGGYVSEIGLLEKLLRGCEDCVDDQRWFTTCFLDQGILAGNVAPDRIYLDYGCNLFQTFAHCWPFPHHRWSDHFGLEGERVVNWTMGGSRPVVIHMNGGGSSNNYARWCFED